jgi:Tol biopolymer transport system component
VVVPLDFYVTIPVWDADGETIFFPLLRRGYGDSDYLGVRGLASYWREGDLRHSCHNHLWQRIWLLSPIADGRPMLALMNNAGRRLAIVDLPSCEEIEELLRLEEQDRMTIFGGDLDPDGEALAYGSASSAPDWTGRPEYSLWIMDLASRISTRVGEGINPAWSPDGDRLAYITLEGLFVRGLEAGGEHRLVEMDLEGRDPELFVPMPPQPRWSPDGRWIVYHRCTEPTGECRFAASDYSIFAVDVETAALVEIVAGGVYPSWRPP